MFPSLYECPISHTGSSQAHSLVYLFFTYIPCVLNFLSFYVATERWVECYTVGSHQLSILSLVWFSCSVTSDSFVTPWTTAYQAPLSMGFPNPAMENTPPALQVRFFTTVYICQSQSPNSTVWFLGNSLYGTGYACWYKPQKVDENNTLSTVISGQWDYE